MSLGVNHPAANRRVLRMTLPALCGQNYTASATFVSR